MEKLTEAAAAPNAASPTSGKSSSESKPNSLPAPTLPPGFFRLRLLSSMSTSVVSQGLILLFTTLISSSWTGAAHAQADGTAVVAPMPAQRYPTPGEPRLAPENAPGGTLMNDLHERMKRMQATSDPVLRQRQQDEFLKNLKSGMESIARTPAVRP